MTALGDFMRQAVSINVEHWRSCPECSGRGEHHKTLKAPNGETPLRAVVARVQCGTCKGKRKILIHQQVRERGVSRVWDY